VANHIGKQKRHVTSNAYDINKPLGEALAAPHKANKINQIGEKKAGKSQSERKCVMGETKGESPDFLFSLFFGSPNLCALFAQPLPRNVSKFSGDRELGIVDGGIGNSSCGCGLSPFFRGWLHVSITHFQMEITSNKIRASSRFFMSMANPNATAMCVNPFILVLAVVWATAPLTDEIS